ncbi:MAG: hypothetical protein ABIS16_00470 [Sphingomicrobium sp.]
MLITISSRGGGAGGGDGKGGAADAAVAAAIATSAVRTFSVARISSPSLRAKRSNPTSGRWIAASLRSSQ